MFERATDRFRKVFGLANQEAQRFNHEHIGPEHLLLGLVKEGSGIGANVLKKLDVDLRKVRLEVEKIVKSGPDMATMGKLPQTPAAKKVVEFAIEEQTRLGHNYLGTEHLLLGLLHEQDPDTVACEVLRSLKVDLGAAREEVLNLLKPEAGQEETMPEKKTPEPIVGKSLDVAGWIRDGENQVLVVRQYGMSPTYYSFVIPVWLLRLEQPGPFTLEIVESGEFRVPRVVYPET